MERFLLERSKDTPKIVLDPNSGTFRLEGESYPENAMEFFSPVLAWVSTFVKEVKRPITADIELLYFNSSSSKCLLDFFDILDAYHREGGAVAVNWYYEEDDEDIRESGEDFAEDLSFSFNLIAKK